MRRALVALLLVGLLAGSAPLASAAATPAEASDGGLLDGLERLVEEVDSFLESVADLLRTVRGITGEGGGGVEGEGG